MNMNIQIRFDDVDGMTELLEVMLPKLDITKRQRDDMEATVEEIIEAAESRFSPADFYEEGELTWNVSVAHAWYILNSLLTVIKLWEEEDKKHNEKKVLFEDSFDFFAMARQLMMKFLKRSESKDDNGAFSMAANLKKRYPTVFARLDLPPDIRYDGQHGVSFDPLAGTCFFLREADLN